MADRITRRAFVARATALAAASSAAGGTRAFGPRAARAAPLLTPPPPARVTVSAGPLARRDAIAVVRLPPGALSPDDRLMLTDEAGGPSAAMQALPSGDAVVRVPGLAAGETRTYRVWSAAAGAPADPPADPPAAVADRKGDGDAVEVRVGGRDVLVYRGKVVPPPAGFGPEYARGGYVEPLTTPAGVRVTDDYPPNHKHHHGVWAPWTATRFEGRKPDFWNMGQKSGTVEFVSLGPTWSGGVAAGFTAAHRFVDRSAQPEPKVALNETWEVQAYAGVGAAAAAGPGEPKAGGKAKPPGYFLFDWQTTQTCASDSPLLLPKYYYGGLGVRGNRQWDGKGNCAFLTAEGKTGKDGNDLPAKWVAMYGKVDGKPAYVAVLGHPGNFRAPQPARLHPTEPFLCFAPQAAGDMAIEPGKPYVARFRFVVGDGEPDRAELDRLWTDYADPVRVEVK